MRPSENPHARFRRKRLTGWIALALLAALILLLVYPGTEQVTPLAVLKEKIRQFFEVRLIFQDPPDSSGAEKAFEDESRSAIYVLGGTFKSLRFKFQEAARLYHDGRAPTIVVMHSDIDTDEWSLRHLKHLGVAPQDVLFIQTDFGFFGTLSEARTLAYFVAEKNIRTLLLVCSDYHGSRVRATFSALLRHEDVRLEIHDVYEPMRILWLLIEYVKKQVYTHILLPHAKMSATSTAAQCGLSTLNTSFIGNKKLKCPNPSYSSPVRQAL